MYIDEYSDAKDLLNYKDKYEQLDYVDVNDNSFYQTIFNRQYSRNDDKANAKEGWIVVPIWNHKNITLDNYNFTTAFIPYIDSNGKSIYQKLYGEVVIFKIDPCTGDLIKKK